MQPTEREEFQAQLASLCAGFNAPMTEARIDAYWRGLQKMALPQFARCIEAALAEGGPEKLPTVSQIWSMHRDMRAKAQPFLPARRVAADPDMDRWDSGANAALMRAAIAHGPRESWAGWDIARRIAAQFRELAADGDPEATYQRMRDVIDREYQRLPAARAA